MYKIAILGCENSHADAFLKMIIEEKLYTDIEVVGVYSYDLEAANKLNEKFGVYVAENFDEFVPVKSKRIYIPSMLHPWKQQYLDNFIDKQEHRLDLAS